MTESNPPMSKIVVQTIIKGLEESKKATEGVQGKVHSIEITVNTIDGKVETMEESVKQLLKIIRDGNGQKPLLTRVTEVENNQKAFQGFIEEQKNIKKAETAGKWQMRVAIISSSFAMLATLGAAYIALFAN
jgi:prophage DNA circulation protein